MEERFWYVYMLQSTKHVDRYYVGMTEDLDGRLKTHNAGHCPYTSKYIPWQIETAVAFRNRDKAVVFEKYLKSHSGRAFAKKHF